MSKPSSAPKFAKKLKEQSAKLEIGDSRLQREAVDALLQAALDYRNEPNEVEQCRSTLFATLDKGSSAASQAALHALVELCIEGLAAVDKTLDEIGARLACGKLHRKLIRPCAEHLVRLGMKAKEDGTPLLPQSSLRSTTQRFLLLEPSFGVALVDVLGDRIEQMWQENECGTEEGDRGLMILLLDVVRLAGVKESTEAWAASLYSSAVHRIIRLATSADPPFPFHPPATLLIAHLLTTVQSVNDASPPAGSYAAIDGILAVMERGAGHLCAGEGREGERDEEARESLGRLVGLMALTLTDRAVQARCSDRDALAALRRLTAPLRWPIDDPLATLKRHSAPFHTVLVAFAWLAWTSEDNCDEIEEILTMLSHHLDAVHADIPRGVLSFVAAPLLALQQLLSMASLRTTIDALIGKCIPAAGAAAPASASLSPPQLSIQRSAVSFRACHPPPLSTEVDQTGDALICPFPHLVPSSILVHWREAMEAEGPTALPSCWSVDGEVLCADGYVSLACAVLMLWREQPWARLRGLQVVFEASFGDAVVAGRLLPHLVRFVEDEQNAPLQVLGMYVIASKSHPKLLLPPTFKAIQYLTTGEDDRIRALHIRLMGRLYLHGHMPLSKLSRLVAYEGGDGQPAVVRLAQLSVLGDMAGEQPDDAVECLSSIQAALKDPSPAVSSVALGCLTRLCCHDLMDFAKVWAILTKKHPHLFDYAQEPLVHYAVAHFLSRYAHVALKDQIDAITKDKGGGGGAVTPLGHLEYLSGHSHPEVRRAAYRGLAALFPGYFYPPITTTTTTDTQPSAPAADKDSEDNEFDFGGSRATKRTDLPAPSATPDRLVLVNSTPSDIVSAFERERDPQALAGLGEVMTAVMKVEREELGRRKRTEGLDRLRHPQLALLNKVLSSSNTSSAPRPVVAAIQLFTFTPRNVPPAAMPESKGGKKGSSREEREREARENERARVRQRCMRVVDEIIEDWKTPAPTPLMRWVMPNAWNGFVDRYLNDMVSADDPSQHIDEADHLFEHLTSLPDTRYSLHNDPEPVTSILHALAALARSSPPTASRAIDYLSSLLHQQQHQQQQQDAPAAHPDWLVSSLFQALASIHEAATVAGFADGVVSRMQSEDGDVREGLMVCLVAEGEANWAHSGAGVWEMLVKGLTQGQQQVGWGAILAVARMVVVLGKHQPDEANLHKFLRLFDECGGHVETSPLLLVVMSTLVPTLFFHSKVTSDEVRDIVRITAQLLGCSAPPALDATAAGLVWVGATHLATSLVPMVRWMDHQRQQADQTDDPNAQLKSEVFSLHEMLSSWVRPTASSLPPFLASLPSMILKSLRPIATATLLGVPSLIPFPSFLSSHTHPSLALPLERLDSLHGGGRGEDVARLVDALVGGGGKRSGAGGGGGGGLQDGIGAVVVGMVTQRLKTLRKPVALDILKDKSLIRALICLLVQSVTSPSPAVPAPCAHLAVGLKALSLLHCLPDLNLRVLLAASLSRATATPDHVCVREELLEGVVRFCASHAGNDGSLAMVVLDAVGKYGHMTRRQRLDVLSGLPAVAPLTPIRALRDSLTFLFLELPLPSADPPLWTAALHSLALSVDPHPPRDPSKPHRMAPSYPATKAKSAQTLERAKAAADVISDVVLSRLDAAAAAGDGVPFSVCEALGDVLGVVRGVGGEIEGTYGRVPLYTMGALVLKYGVDWSALQPYRDDIIRDHDRQGNPIPLAAILSSDRLFHQVLSYAQIVNASSPAGRIESLTALALTQGLAKVRPVALCALAVTVALYMTAPSLAHLLFSSMQDAAAQQAEEEEKRGGGGERSDGTHDAWSEGECRPLVDGVDVWLPQDTGDCFLEDCESDLVSTLAFTTQRSIHDPWWRQVSSPADGAHPLRPSYTVAVGLIATGLLGGPPDCLVRPPSSLLGSSYGVQQWREHGERVKDMKDKRGTADDVQRRARKAALRRRLPLSGW
ncbi:unnamed protein product [Vitrella brassicaformis CCMP3155]|uniref:DUF3730 domain-containing protein n=3 Tax=Vitrella brassicaformis TaxID=1169539 RepID=A0A0G4EI94_VITBC|nr:unnamed protein product [Vitrella brassicaformis CCMP3155]|eukprot:CEL95723.1 unnamed protein product [Vitrella brassicaformis CCMP3155]